MSEKDLTISVSGPNSGPNSGTGLKKQNEEKLKKRRSGTKSFLSNLFLPKHKLMEEFPVASPIYLENSIESKEYENLSIDARYRKYLNGLQTNSFKKHGYVGLKKIKFNKRCEI
jgi:hypothetical protein